MKKYLLFILIAALSLPQNSWAQDDDIYFIPSKEKKEKKAKNTKVQDFESDYFPITEDYEYDNWADNRDNSGRDIDEYNRRKSGNNQEIDNQKYEDNETADGSCTSRIVRFHSPTVGVYVSSPYYSDYVDVWFDPWYYDPWYGYTYVGWGSWYHSPYYWRSSWYWGSPWYSWDPFYSCYYPWYGHHHYYPSYYSGKRGPHGGYVEYRKGDRYAGGSHRGSYNRYGNRYENGAIHNRPSRDFGNRYNNNSTRPTTRPGNGISNSRRPARGFGNSNESRPSRNTNSTTPSRSSRDYDYSRPSRGGFNSGSSRPSRSFNSGFSGGHYRSGGGFGSGHSTRGGRR